MNQHIVVVSDSEVQVINSDVQVVEFDEYFQAKEIERNPAFGHQYGIYFKLHYDKDEDFGHGRVVWLESAVDRLNALESFYKNKVESPEEKKKRIEAEEAAA